MTVLKLLANDGFISYNKIIARQIGVHEAIVLGELCSIANLFNYEEFYFSMEKMSYDTALSEKQLRKALNNLEFMEFLKIEKKGIPCKNWYKLEDKNIEEFLKKIEAEEKAKGKTSSAKSAELEVPKVPNKGGKNGTARGAKSAEPLNKKNTRKNTNNNKDNTEPLSEPRNDIERIEKIYFDNWTILYKRGVVKTEKPAFNYGQCRKRLRDAIDRFSEAEVARAMRKSIDDSYVVSKGYGLNIILSESIMNSLLNSNDYAPKKHVNALYELDHPEDVGDVLF